MTYNFDPDRWLESHLAALEARRVRGEIDEVTFQAEKLELDRRYEEMVARLDKQFEAAYGVFRRGDLDKAEQICRDIIKQMPSRRDAADLLRQIREQRKKLDAATKSP